MRLALPPLLLAACAPPVVRGTIVARDHYSAYTSFIWISHGKYGGHLMPIFHAERWELTIDGFDAEGTPRRQRVSVSEFEYERAHEGDAWHRSEVKR